MVRRPVRTSVRAHRILVPLARYRPIMSGAAPAIDMKGSLGEPIGCYENGDRGNDVWVFDEGLAWANGGEVTAVRFDEIVGTSLPEGKASLAVCVTEKSGRQVVVPVEGRRARAVDALEFCRFVTRVVEDVRRNADGSQGVGQPSRDG
jgi:hypothetical protein